MVTGRSGQVCAAAALMPSAKDAKATSARTVCLMIVSIDPVRER